MFRPAVAPVAVSLAGAAMLLSVATASAQVVARHDVDTDSAGLGALVRQAVAVNPAIKAAERRVAASRSRVLPAGLPPDPKLTAGIENLPLGHEAGMIGPDPMTMRVIGIGQTIPYPGKLSLARRVAAREVDASQASIDATTQQVVRDVKDAYYELAFVDQALSIVARNRDVLAGFIRVTETRYGVGAAGQQDVLKADVEATRLAETAVTLTEQRRAALARLDALLDRPSDAPVDHPAVPATIARAAVSTAAGEIHFSSDALGARVADSPIPPVAELQAIAMRYSPDIREHEAMIAAQAARLELARKEALPDFDIALQYGQRGGGRPDMVSATVSVPLPVFKGRKQDQFAAAAEEQLAALHAEHEVKVNEIRAKVARISSELERSRGQLALYVKALLPQARASLSAATASYQVGRVEFLTVLDDQATVFNYETEYFRALSDFARNLAELERVVGKEIIQ